MSTRHEAEPAPSPLPRLQAGCVFAGARLACRPSRTAQVHEIKVRRADLIGELRAEKIERYRELAASLIW